MVALKNLAGLKRATTRLERYFSLEVYNWLDEKIKQLLLDYLTLKDNYDLPSNLSSSKEYFYDYSFLLTPAFKALEGTIIQIGKELDLPVEKNKYSVGGFFNNEELEKYYSNVLNEIEHLNDDDKAEIKEWLTNARRFLTPLRNTPAHFSGKIKENTEVTFMAGQTILHTIEEVCRVMIKKKLFPSILNAEEEKRNAENKIIIGEIENEQKRRQRIKDAGYGG